MTPTILNVFEFKSQASLLLKQFHNNTNKEDIIRMRIIVCFTNLSTLQNCLICQELTAVSELKLSSQNISYKGNRHFPHVLDNELERITCQGRLSALFHLIHLAAFRDT